MIDAIKTGVGTIIRPIIWFVCSVGVMTILYWCLVRFIAAYCAPSDLYGIMMTAFTMGSPFCQAFTQILAKVSEYYLILWSSIVTGFVAWFITVLHLNDTVSN
jgi:hypothetical protein